MIQIFDSFDTGCDFAVLVVVVQLAMIAALAWMVRQAWRECRAQRRQAEELACWGELQIEEINDLRKRLEVAERHHAHLQAMYVDLVRRRLAQSYSLIQENRTRQRRK